MKCYKFVDLFTTTDPLALCYLMGSNSFSFYSNVFGFVAGGISLIGLAFGFCGTHLPSKKIKVLEELLDDTQTLFKSCVEEGLLPQPRFRFETERQLARLREDTLDLRSRAYIATTFIKDCAALLNGLSNAIGRACSELKRVRADVITQSDIERRGRRNNTFLSKELPFSEQGHSQASDTPSLDSCHCETQGSGEVSFDTDPFVGSTCVIRATIPGRDSTEIARQAGNSSIKEPVDQLTESHASFEQSADNIVTLQLRSPPRPQHAAEITAQEVPARSPVSA
ncbi:hypothetical protein BS17DRAFT_878590 [Gyrodon lividus]|nr:hypothetical protein BS17DRAFT_878590 [Gyrodon lividus]